MDLINEEKNIADARAATNKAIAEHDIEALSYYWMDDIIIIRGNGTIIATKETAINVWQKMFNEEPAVSYVRYHKEIIISNNKLFAWEKGRWQGINTYSNGGNYAAMWCKQNDVWKLKAELFVSL